MHIITLKQFLTGEPQTECISDKPTPSAASEECTGLHNSRPELANTTTHIFSVQNQEKSNDYSFERTCYPAFLENNSKGWCSVRRSGQDVNEIPEADVGWGFCSTDASQEDCNSDGISTVKDDRPQRVTFLNDDQCLDQLRENLNVEQPDAAQAHNFEDIVEGANNVCVGQIHKHSFQNEKFVYMTNLAAGSSAAYNEVNDDSELTRLQVYHIAII